VVIEERKSEVERDLASAEPALNVRNAYQRLSGDYQGLLGLLGLLRVIRGYQLLGHPSLVMIYIYVYI